MTIFLDVSKRKTPEGPVHPFCATRRDRPARQPEALRAGECRPFPQGALLPARRMVPGHPDLGAGRALSGQS